MKPKYGSRFLTGKPYYPIENKPAIFDIYSQDVSVTDRKRSLQALNPTPPRNLRDMPKEIGNNVYFFFFFFFFLLLLLLLLLLFELRVGICYQTNQPTCV
jgi:hypothetical protein